ncbi:MAG: ribbon-helix-helix protein, CopG family [Brasilonema angustatum HA4187-MV1]|nr:ribbon-helix-helix protein, CopG family [Brasilonema angustatum HA4187-MV1]
MFSKETIQIRLPKTEKDRLDSYCQKTGRSITDVLREFIRSLPE